MLFFFLNLFCLFLFSFFSFFSVVLFIFSFFIYFLFFLLILSISKELILFFFFVCFYSLFFLFSIFILSFQIDIIMLPSALVSIICKILVCGCSENILSKLKQAYEIFSFYNLNKYINLSQLFMFCNSSIFLEFWHFLFCH